MRTIRAVGVVGLALGGALGIGLAACGGGTSNIGGDGEGGTGEGGGLDGGGGGDGATDGGGPRPDGGACTSPTPVVVAGKDTGFVRCAEGYSHRVAHADCPSLVPRPNVTCSPGGKDAGMECGDDTDCTAKPNGVCGAGNGGPFFCSCTYGCVRDSDCASGQICECGEPVGFCVNAVCTDDSKCSPPSLCAGVPGGFGGCGLAPNTYVCQSAADRCDVAKDCPDGKNGQPQICGYDPDAGARVCGEGPLPCPGRPFLVHAVARVAPIARRADWSARGAMPDVCALPADLRAALAEHWTRAAQMEHASIAAFARFALELLALGAPSWAIVDTNAAMADETAHAEIAFALASAYAGQPIGPAPLAIDGAVGPITERSVFATLVREGCIGETLAAILATDALESAEDPAVRDALETIAADETRHATLSWRVARWLLQRGDDAFRAWAIADMSRAIDEAAIEHRRGRTAARSVPSAAARRHGLPAEEAALVESALRAVIRPCAASLTVTTADGSADDRVETT